MEQLKIDFEEGDIYPGSLLRGKLTVRLDRPKRYKCITVRLKGWSNALLNLVGVNEVLQYCDEEKVVWSKQDSQTGELSAGEHTFPFQFKLPPNIPSCFASHSGVMYHVSATVIKKGFGSNQVISAPFIVKEARDIQTLCKEPLTASMTKKVFGSGLVSATVSIPRFGFSSGESIECTVKVCNETSRSVRIGSTLVKQDICTFPIRINRLAVTETPGAMSWWMPEVGPGETVSLNFKQQVPGLIPTNRLLPNYHMEYCLLVTMKIPWSFDKSLRIPIVIQSPVASGTLQTGLGGFVQSGPSTFPLPPGPSQPLLRTTGLGPGLTGPLPPGLTGPLPPGLTGPLPPGLTGPLPPGVTGPFPPGLTGPLDLPPGLAGPLPPGLTGPLQPNALQEVDPRMLEVFQHYQQDPRLLNVLQHIQQQQSPMQQQLCPEQQPQLQDACPPSYSEAVKDHL